MQIDVDDVAFYVIFRHYPYEAHPWGVGATECAISWVPKRSRSGDSHTICEKTYCSSSDKFNERNGRVASLTKALKPFPRETRALFWAEYERVYGGLNGLRRGGN